MGKLYNSFHDLMTQMLGWVEAFATTPYGGWALFVLAFAESSFFPIPPDVLLIALCLGDPGKAYWFATLCSVGSVLGGVAGYGIGYYGGRPLMRRLFNERKIRAVEDLYDRYNAWATGVAGLTPLPYKLFTISGGVFAINFKIFLLASVIARTLRFFVVAALISLVGEPAKRLIDEHLGWLSIAFVILLITGFYIVGKGFGGIGSDHAEETHEERADKSNG